MDQDHNGFQIGNGKNELKHILDTDYSNYLIVYYCQDQLVSVDYQDEETGEPKKFDQLVQLKMFSVYSRQTPKSLGIDVINHLYLLLLEHVEIVTDQKGLFLETHTEMNKCEMEVDEDLFLGDKSVSIAKLLEEQEVK